MLRMFLVGFITVALADEALAHPELPEGSASDAEGPNSSTLQPLGESSEENDFDDVSQSNADKLKNTVKGDHTTPLQQLVKVQGASELEAEKAKAAEKTKRGKPSQDMDKPLIMLDSTTAKITIQHPVPVPFSENLLGEGQNAVLLSQVKVVAPSKFLNDIPGAVCSQWRGEGRGGDAVVKELCVGIVSNPDCKAKESASSTIHQKLEANSTVTEELKKALSKIHELTKAVEELKKALAAEKTKQSKSNLDKPLISNAPPKSETITSSHTAQLSCNNTENYGFIHADSDKFTKGAWSRSILDTVRIYSKSCDP